MVLVTRGLPPLNAIQSQRVGRLRCRTQLGLSPVPERTGKLAPLTPFYSIIVPVVQFSGDRRFCYGNHGSFVYDSPNLFCGPSGSVRTGLTGVRSEPGHRTHLTSLLSKSVPVIPRYGTKCAPSSCGRRGLKNRQKPLTKALSFFRAWHVAIDHRSSISIAGPGIVPVHALWTPPNFFCCCVSRSTFHEFPFFFFFWNFEQNYLPFRKSSERENHPA